jgi:hypothetical protein
MKDMKRLAAELKDLAYEVEDAIDQAELDRAGMNLDSMSEIITEMLNIIEKAES